MKSILQVWREYLESRNATNFSELGIVDYTGRFELFSEVTGFHRTKDENGNWLVFDCHSHHAGKTRHVIMKGNVTKKITLDDKTQ